jgi:type VI secretion system protein ImpK
MADNPFAKPDGGNRTILQIPRDGPPATATPGAVEMPKAQSDDGNRTIIRPSPGRRQPNAVPAAGGIPQAARQEVPAARSMAPAAGIGSIYPGEDALTAAAVPLLQLMARLNNTANPPDSGDLREWTVRQIRIFEQDMGDKGLEPEQLRAAHYALCVSLDDVVLSTPWGSRGTWRAQPLVVTFHREAGSEERFFEVLRQMCNNPRKSLPVIKLMYLCLSLGFMGRYRASAGGGADIKRIREEIYAIILRQEKVAAPELAPHVKGVSAPYRPTSVRVPLWVAASAGLGFIAALFAWFAIALNADSDVLQARARDVPPARMPDIARAPIVEAQPVARQSLPPPEPTALDRVRNSLRPEVEQGLVEVTGTAAQPLVRVGGSGMFAPGSATVQPASKPLLNRIGQALGGEAGNVRVIGYTDDRSIRTIAFPSNAQLSAARAQAASAILAAGIGDASRVSFEGRADAEPIATNATPEGRERNRRIEIVLSRQGP